MGFLWMIIVFGIVINIVNVESEPCPGKVYKKSEAANGHCFFEPDDANYREKINVANSNVAPPYNYEFNMDEARKICKENGAEVLQWDTLRMPGAETEAIKTLRARMDGNVTIYVPCAGKVPGASDCFTGQNKTDKGITKWYVLDQEGITSQSGETGGYYDKNNWDGLICHHQPDATTNEPPATTSNGIHQAMTTIAPLLAVVIAMVNP